MSAKTNTLKLYNLEVFPTDDVYHATNEFGEPITTLRRGIVVWDDDDETIPVFPLKENFFLIASKLNPHSVQYEIVRAEHIIVEECTFGSYSIPPMVAEHLRKFFVQKQECECEDDWEKLEEGPHYEQWMYPFPYAGESKIAVLTSEAYGRYKRANRVLRSLYGYSFLNMLAMFNGIEPRKFKSQYENQKSKILYKLFVNFVGGLLSADSDLPEKLLQEKSFIKFEVPIVLGDAKELGFTVKGALPGALVYLNLNFFADVVEEGEKEGVLIDWPTKEVLSEFPVTFV